jgi:uncharacterized protein (TIGR03437 family)
VFFPFGPTRHIAAQHGPPDYAYLGPPGLIPGLTLTPARPGEIVLLYGTGFGPTEPQTPSGVIVGSGARVVTPLVVRIGGVQAAAQGFISAAGLYVLVVTVPETLPDGDHAVVAELGSARTQNNMTISVRR